MIVGNLDGLPFLVLLILAWLLLISHSIVALVMGLMGKFKKRENITRINRRSIYLFSLAFLFFLGLILTAGSSAGLNYLRLGVTTLVCGSLAFVVPNSIKFLAWMRTPGSPGFDRSEYIPLKQYAADRGLGESEMRDIVRNGLHDLKTIDGEWHIHKDTQ